ncbi:type I polyketide synthase [Desulfoluna butyratoxydans]|uniref:Acyl transferase n=1 Tax=Desulfoluna butyratoxydans TaxID=231438 RepID=A0A4U8YK94_9BACT|nr:type I polyketide synthase [Desulfoluna butyratoxydans]VFQ43910.1 acyl transferase [Desulfoluna butyratoxydans]
MIKRVLGSRLPALAYNPTGAFDIGYFRALSRAGVLPVFDTEMMDEKTAIEGVKTLSKEGFPFGVRLRTSMGGLIHFLDTSSIPTLDLVVVAAAAAKHFSAISKSRLGCKVVVEAVNLGTTFPLADGKPDAVVVRGSEAGGCISRYTSFILLQWYLEKSDFPVFVHGGVGFHTAAGLFGAGASGVVLDSQLYLTDEAPVAPAFKEQLKKLEEFDSISIGRTLPFRFRFFCKLATKVVKELGEMESALLNHADEAEVLRREIEKRFTPINTEGANPVQSLFFLGQDGVFAKRFVAEGTDVASVIDRFFTRVGELTALVDAHDPLKENSPLAQELGTRYPIMQGPMANISDNADFAETVFREGGLPYFAMGSLPADLAEKIIEEGSRKVPRFGAGLIGIEALNKAVAGHIETVKKYKVPFALFAGGIPSQAIELEAAGTKTFLHTPASGMLKNALSSGCKRFIFEGTEAGGHVGRLSSLVLWEMGITHLLAQPEGALANQTAIFAGGIATRTGSWFISAMSAVLAEKGAKVGIQLGTPYLFTDEIVETGALMKKYQDVAREEITTLRIGTTVGLACRTIKTPFSMEIVANEYQRIVEKVSLSDRKRAFEKDNIGSLLIAAKGFSPDFDKLKKGEPLSYIKYNDDEAFHKGNYSVGNSLAFFAETTSVKAVHDGQMQSKEGLSANLNELEVMTAKCGMMNDEIAIIGMGCVYPDAHDTDDFWKNIESKRYSIKEVDPARVDLAPFYNENRKAMDSTYTKIAATVDDFVFDPAAYGQDPKAGQQISRSQKMALTATFEALEKAGYPQGKGLPLATTAVIMGSCLGNETSHHLNLKYYYPELRWHLEQSDAFKALTEDEKVKVLAHLKDRMAGDYRNESPDCATLNIEASRVAAAIGALGANYVVDAACATSFAALDSGIKELLSGSHDVVITGGINTSINPETFIGFAKMGALSAKGSWPFDERSDGFVLGEGAGVVVLKRAKDALRDGDTILGIVKGVGGSSDGKGKAIAAPNPDGQEYALRRCFDQARGLTFDDVDFIEAHGTSTILGDITEIKTLKRVYDTGRPKGISSVKSQIGHLLGGAGAAGLIKVLLAMKHGILPPNGQFEKASPKHELDDNSKLYIIKDAKPWTTEAGKPKRAAVSAYGFGGINYHAVVEEFTSDYQPPARTIFPDTAWDYNDDRIVISGMGTVLPGGLSTDQFWETLVDGKKILSEMPENRLHLDYFVDEENDFSLPRVKAGVIPDYTFNNLKYRIPPKTAKSIDRAQFFALDAATQAIDEACGGDREKMFGKANKTAVIMGSISGEKHVENIVRTRAPLVASFIAETPGVDPAKAAKAGEALMESIRERFMENNEDTTPGLLTNIITGRIANFFGANGANFVVDAACASGGIAADLSVKGLKAGDFDMVVAGGVDASFYPAIMMVFKRLGVLTDAETFICDKRAKGIHLGEGAAALVLTTYKKAKELNMPVFAELSEIGFRSNPARNLYAPSEALFREVTTRRFDRCDVIKEDVAHVDLFGFSSLMLDQVELQAASKSFGHKTRLGNIKPEFGYYKGANPAIALVKLALMAKHGKLLPHHSHSSEHSIVADRYNLVPGLDLADAPKGHRLSLGANLFGFGANHGHAVVSTLPRWMSEEAASFAEEAATETVAAPMPHGEVHAGESCALLCGQGSQYPKMMQPVYESNAYVKEMFDKADALFRKERGTSLLEVMFAEEDARIHSTDFTQPAVFLATAAVFDLLSEAGFDTDYHIGHSVGEYSALYTSGILSFDDAFRLVMKRSELMKKADQNTPGRILVLFKNAEEAAALIAESGIGDIYVTNKNSTKQTAVSGLEGAIDTFCGFLTQKGAMFRKLPLTGAFHTPILRAAADELARFIEGMAFNRQGFSKVISNVTGLPYPNDEAAVKRLLINQIISPVEFIKSVETVHAAGVRTFYEVGTGKILTGLLKYILPEGYTAHLSVDKGKGEAASLEALIETIRPVMTDTVQQDTPAAHAAAAPKAPTPAAVPVASAPSEAEGTFSGDHDDFNAFLQDNSESLKALIEKEYIKSRREKRLREVETFGFYTGSISIAGVSIGLPGSSGRVFDEANFDKIIAGHNCIENLTEAERGFMLDKNIVRIHKAPNGNARMMAINSPEEVIQLAGKLGYFHHSDFGIKYNYDISINLGIAAGINALRDAGIPLVRNWTTGPSGKRITNGFALPEEMQETTGVIMTSLFQGWETLLTEVENYCRDKFSVKPFKEMEKIYYYLMETVKDTELKGRLTDWFFGLKKDQPETPYQFNRELIINAIALGSAHFAQMIKAKGPNLLLSGACASTTQACATAEDWIRTGRCERVIVIGGEAATNKAQVPWIASSFLSMGAASIKKTVAEAAKPFDTNRNGTILGAGAVSLIVERKDSLAGRGQRGQADILGSYIGNSAFHSTRIDQEHLARELSRFVSRIEARHGLKRDQYAEKALFMSHETYTPARGGSADAEIKALRAAFGEHASKVTIANTKGFTGHTLGAAIEDAVMVKALAKNQAPPIANLTDLAEEFSDLTFSRGEEKDLEYGIHFAAGFGSHFAFLFIREEAELSRENNADYFNWLKHISGEEYPVLEVVDHTLRVQSDTTPGGRKTIEAPAHVNAQAAPAEKPAPAPAAQTAAQVQEQKPAPAEAAPAAAASGAVDTVKRIIAEETGYTTDMLEDDLDLEADLGIDTVKQVEVFGKISSEFGLDVPENLQLRDLNTIAKLAGYISAQGGAAAAPAEAAPATPAVNASGAVDAIKKIIAEETGYTTDMLEDDLDLEADLGIDTVKQVEVFGKISAEFGLDVPEDLQLRDLNTIAKLAGYISAQGGAAAPAEAAPAAPAINASGAVDIVKNIIAEETGYTTDMLEDDLDLEADLGIDTVKQVEVFGKISAEFGLDVPEDLQLRDLNTIAKLAGYISAQGGASAAAPAEAAPAAPAANASGAVDTVKNIIAEETGYTTDMLEDDLDLEADLGIDTVKQVEVFGKISAEFGLDVPEDLQLRDLNTIAKLAGYISAQGGAAAAAPAEAAPAAPTANASGAVDTVKQIIAEETGYTTDMLEDDLDLEADLGIDTVKQVEVFGKISAEFGLDVPEDLQLRDLNTIAKLAGYISAQGGASTAAPAEAAPAAPAANASGAVETVKNIIAEETGYTTDMLDEDLDLEADLGIDTVKQVEVFGKISAEFGLDVPEDLQLRDLNTIAKLAGYISAQGGAPAAAPAEAAPAAPAADASCAVETVKNIIAEETGYTTDMLDEGLDLEADLGIDTVKQVEVFGKISAEFGLDVPEDLQLRDLNTIAKLAGYIAAQGGTAPAEAAPAAPAASGTAPAATGVVSAIKGIIADETGYTVDMLDDGLDLEADLGIDTVKQVEVFGKISAHFGLDVPEDLQLRDLNSIESLAGYVTERAHIEAPESGSPSAPAPAGSGVTDLGVPAFEEGGVNRYAIRVKQLGERSGVHVDLAKKTILVTQDRHGFADQVKLVVEARGGRVITLGSAASTYPCDLADHEALVATLAEMKKREPSVDGLLHLSAMDGYLENCPNGVAADAEGAIKGFFLILRELQESLNRDGALIGALSVGSVVFPYGDAGGAKSHPAFAGLSGMLKTVNKEFENALVRIIDLAPGITAADARMAAAAFMGELTNGSRRVETGLESGKRLGLRLVAESSSKGTPLMKAGDTVVVTGGARGITYDILKKVVAHAPCNLVILGRSDIEGLAPEFATGDLSEGAVMAKLRATMKGAKPLELKRAASKIVKIRETRDNLDTLRQAAQSVAYHAVDAADTQAVTQAMAGYAKIDGVIHAAGLEESAMIEKKELSSFNRVFNTKIKGAENLFKGLEGKTPRFVITFSSVTARFGNEAQVDYTCANDMLGRMVQRFGAEKGCIAKIMDWTAWSGSGMAATNDTVKKVLESRGLTFLPLDRGVDFFMGELAGTESCESLFTGPDIAFDRDFMFEEVDAAEFDRQTPFIDEVKAESDDKMVFTRVLDLKRDLFLKDHSMKDVPIFLGATGIETMAEAASRLFPRSGARLESVTDFSIPYGIKILKERPKELEIETEKSDKGEDALNCRITSTFRKGKITGKTTLHYEGTFHFTDKPVEDRVMALPEFTKVKLDGTVDELVYHPERLFMHGSFRTIRDIASFDGETLVTKVIHNGEREFFKGETRPEFFTDVIMVDAMFQTGGLFEFFTTSELVLPYGLEKFEFVRPVERGKEYYCITQRVASDDRTNTYRMVLTDLTGKVYLDLTNFRMVKLSRLDDKHKISGKVSAA